MALSQFIVVVSQTGCCCIEHVDNVEELVSFEWALAVNKGFPPLIFEPFVICSSSGCLGWGGVGWGEGWC